MQLEENVVLLIYYNVLFYLFFKLEKDDFKKQYLINKIEKEDMRMKQIQEWCYYHQVPFRTKFIYRKDFPLKANLWDLYSYSRFKIDLIRGKKILHI